MKLLLLLGLGAATIAGAFALAAGAARHDRPPAAAADLGAWKSVDDATLSPEARALLRSAGSKGGPPASSLEVDEALANDASVGLARGTGARGLELSAFARDGQTGIASVEPFRAAAEVCRASRSSPRIRAGSRPPWRRSMRAVRSSRPSDSTRTRIPSST